MSSTNQYTYIDTIDINGEEYILEQDLYSNLTLKTYDWECKIWVRLGFTGIEAKKEKLLDILSNEYISQVTS